jgi:hypothetical protein
MVRARTAAGVALTFECELGYTFDPAVWGQGFATETVRCVRDYARDVLRLTYAISVILPQNARSRRVAERFGVRATGQLEVLGLTWERYVWPLATGGAPQLQPASTKLAWPVQARAVALDFTLWSTGPARDRHAQKRRHPCRGRGPRPGWDVDLRLPRTTIWCPLHLDLDPGRGYEVRVPGLSCSK